MTGTGLESSMASVADACRVDVVRTDLHDPG
jgi:hypothetical protein